MKWKSNATWPKGCFDGQNNRTDDTHDTMGQAEAICQLLEENGAGGERKVFPVSTWVSEIDTSPRTSEAVARIEKKHTHVGVNVSTSYKPAFIELGFEMAVMERELTLAQSELAASNTRYEKLRAAVNGILPRELDYLSELQKQNIALRADADRKTALIVELREKLSELQQRLNTTL